MNWSISAKIPIASNIFSHENFETFRNLKIFDDWKNLSLSTLQERISNFLMPSTEKPESKMRIKMTLLTKLERITCT